MNEQRAAAILIGMLIIGLLFLFACMMLTAQPKRYTNFPDIVLEANQLKIGQYYQQEKPTK